VHNLRILASSVSGKSVGFVFCVRICTFVISTCSISTSRSLSMRSSHNTQCRMSSRSKIISIMIMKMNTSSDITRLMKSPLDYLYSLTSLRTPTSPLGLISSSRMHTKRFKRETSDKLDCSCDCSRETQEHPPQCIKNIYGFTLRKMKMILAKMSLHR